MLSKFKIIFAIILLAMPFGALSKGFLLNGEQLEYLSKAVQLSEEKKYEEALVEVKKTKDAQAINLIKWLQYRSSYEGNDFLQIKYFMNDKTNWPSSWWIKNTAEKSIDINTNYRKILKYFGKTTPITGYGKFLLARAMTEKSKYDEEKVHSLIKDAWAYGDFSLDIEENILKNYAKILSNSEHIKRIDRLLWGRKINDAKRILGLADENYQNLFSARIALMQKSDEYYPHLKLIPAKLLNDSGLLYELAKRYKRDKDYNKLFNILYKINNEATHYKKWWKLRNYLTRQFLDEKEYKKAYLIASGSSAKKGSYEYAESQWLAGWIAMTKLDDSSKAYKHFYKLYDNVRYPISLSRGSYWAGRAAENKGFDNIAEKWYEIAAKNPSVFYGQLAHIKINGDEPLNFPEEEEVKSYKFIHDNQLLKIATMLFQINKENLAEKFLIKATDNVQSQQEFTQISHFARKMRNDFYRVVVSKRAIRKKFILLEDGWPVPEYFTDNLQKRPLSLAISRQESRFYKKATSPAHAYGLMQIIMPTAKQLCQELTEKECSKQKLLEDPYFNVKLGNHYINSLVDDFDGSYVLAIASYNAGPTNVKKWILRHGDPRTFKNHEDVIQWIEQIPFKETRNYVQRVLENQQIYQQILEKKPTMLDKNLLP